MIEAPIVRPLGNLLQRFLLKINADLTVTGLENVPREGGLIIVANHQSNFDPPLVSAIIPRPVSFLAKREIFAHPVANWFLRSYGAYPINREGIDVSAYKWTVESLRNQAAIAMFPEGTRNRGGMGKALPGVAQLALRTGTPILPVGITGTAHLGPWIRVFMPTGRFTVTVGQPFTLRPVNGKATKEVVESHTISIMLKIAELLPPEYRGIYATGQHHADDE